MIIGITGNSGSGKSEISKILAQKINAKIIDADEIVRKLAEPGHEYYEKQVELFGKEILINNQLNRRKISEIIYNNSDKRQALDKLTYKYVVNEIIKETQSEKEKNIIIDAPLLFESVLNNICDFTIGIIAKKEIKIERICKRDKIEKNTAEARLSIQKDDEFYIKNADLIMVNNGNLDEINWEEICTKIGKN